MPSDLPIGWWFPWFDAPPTAEDILYEYRPGDPPPPPPDYAPEAPRAPEGNLTLPLTLVGREDGGRWSRRALAEECDGDEVKADRAFALLYAQPVMPWEWDGPRTDEADYLVPGPGAVVPLLTKDVEQPSVSSDKGRRMSPEQVATIHERRAMGDTLQRIANDIGFTRAAVIYHLTKPVDRP